jgi:hypothetical protein
MSNKAETASAAIDSTFIKAPLLQFLARAYVGERSHKENHRD